jgi:hypothetical protein
VINHDSIIDRGTGTSAAQIVATCAPQFASDVPGGRASAIFTVTITTTLCACRSIGARRVLDEIQHQQNSR